MEERIGKGERTCRDDAYTTSHNEVYRSPTRPVRLKALNETVPGCTAVVCGGPSCAAALLSPRQVLDELRAAIRETCGGILVESFGCLGPCTEGQAVVVVHRRFDRSIGGASSPAVWIAIADEATADSVSTWIKDGGPGVAPMSPRVDNAIVGLL